MISIILPVHNGERFLSEAIESILTQSFRNFECLVINDGSTDGTQEILEDLSRRDERIQVITLEKAGLVTALNTGIHHAKGDWIARLDADDVMEPGRLQKQLDFVASNPEISVLASFVRYINEAGKIIGDGRSRFTNTQAVQAALKNGDLIGLHHPSILARKSALISAGGYREEAWLAEDTDLWTRMAGAGAVVLVQPEFLTRYRIHGASVSRAKMATQNEVVAWLKRCLYCRQQGQPEPTKEAFLLERAAQSRIVKLDRWRRSTAKNLYKNASLNFANRRPVAFVSALIGALVLQPSHVWKQLRSKLAPPKTPANGR